MLQLKHILHPFILCAVLLAGCEDALTKAVKKAASDKNISEEECSSFDSIVLSKKSEYRNLLAGDSIKNDALLNRIRWIIGNKPIRIECAKNEKIVKARYEVYLENSGSMDGYVNGNTDFKINLHAYLNDIQLKTNNLTEEMKLFYINSEKIPFSSSLTDFILDLNPSSFRKHGGNRQTTDFVKMFDALLKTCAKDKVVIFISDCVLSPEKGKTAEEFLSVHQEALKKTFNDYLSEKKISKHSS